jgi:hypothetical protein
MGPWHHLFTRWHPGLVEMDLTASPATLKALVSELEDGVSPPLNVASGPAKPQVERFGGEACWQAAEQCFVTSSSRVAELAMDGHAHDIARRVDRFGEDAAAILRVMGPHAVGVREMLCQMTDQVGGVPTCAPHMLAHAAAWHATAARRQDELDAVSARYVRSLRKHRVAGAQGLASLLHFHAVRYGLFLNLESSIYLALAATLPPR